jgi:glycosyltransferase involved in cell wall biosynthesis/Tfp pilus assembly protein PilF
MRRFNAKRRKVSVITLADRARDTRQWELAAELYHIALDRNARNPPIWVQLGHVLKESGKLQEAEDAYRRAISCDPNAAEPYLQMGHLLKLQNKREEAMTAYVGALARDPNLAPARDELTGLGWKEHREQAMVSEAVSDTSFSSPKVRRRPTRITLADRARDAGEWARAAQFYRQALDRNPCRPNIWVQYGHMLKESGHVAAAERAYRTAIAHDPQIADPHLQLGHILKLRDRQQEAEAAYMRAFAIDPSLPAPLPELRQLGWSQIKIAQLRALADEPRRVGNSGTPSRNGHGAEPPSLANTSLVENSVSQGFRENEGDFSLRLWREHFDADSYLQTNPDVADGGMGAFEHFLLYGLKEGRQPCFRVPIRGSFGPVTEAWIHCLKPPTVRGEVALLATYSPDGRLKPHVRHYLDCLKRHNIGVILIVTAERPFVGEADLVSALDGMFSRQAKGYDFAAWAHVLRLYPKLFDAQILYLLNDSVFGPTNDAAFGKLLRRLRDSRADFIGLTENWVWNWHYQSYFMAFKPGALHSTVFQKFVHDIVAFDDQQDVIHQYECRLAWLLKTGEVESDLLFRTTRFGDPTIFEWRSLLQMGFPFLKVKTVRNPLRNVDLSGWRELLVAEGYDVSLAEGTLNDFSAGERISKEEVPASAFESSGVETIPSTVVRASRLASRVRSEVGSTSLDVLICGHDLSESGAPRAAFNVARVLRRAGHSVVFASPSDGPFRERLCNLGIEVFIDHMLLDQHRDTFPLAHNFDKVFCNTVDCWPIVAQLRHVSPVYWYIHESEFLHERVRDFPALLPVLRSGVTILVPSLRTASVLAVYGVTAEIIEYGIEDPEGLRRPALGADAGKTVIGVFGSYELRKGQDLAVAGMLCVPKELRDQAELRFFGRTLDPVFRSNLEQIAGNERSIVFLGEVNHCDCLNQMAACDIVLTSSRDDPLPFVTLDALSLGKTVVCSHSTGTSAYLQDGQSGLILRENTPDEIGRVLARAISDPGLRATLGRGGRGAWEQTFTMGNFAAKLHAALAID